MTRTLPWGASDAPPWPVTLLNFAAAALRAASDVLARRAARVSAAAARDGALAGLQTVEFHSLHRDSGAPEGALYINGELVGVISGVSRL